MHAHLLAVEALSVLPIRMNGTLPAKLSVSYTRFEALYIIIIIIMYIRVILWPSLTQQGYIIMKLKYKREYIYLIVLVAQFQP